MKAPQFLKKKRFYFALIIVVLLYLLYHFLQLRKSDEAFKEAVSHAPFEYELQIGYYKTNSRKMRYVEIGNDSLPLVVFIHGSPSSSSIWMRFFRDSALLRHAKILAVDRPGYGYSGFGDIVTSVEKQARMIMPLLKSKKEKGKKIVLVGGSYGGTVAAKIAMDSTSLIDGLVLLSASLKPGAETTFWITYPTSKWPLKWLIPSTLRMANEEKLSHKKELEKMLPFWDQITVPVTIIQGDADDLVYPSNAYFAKKKLVNAPDVRMVIKEGVGHSFIWTEDDVIIKEIIMMLKQIKKEKSN